MEKLSNNEMFLLSSVMGSDAILHQERHGQGQVVMNDVIPINCPRADLEALGFVFGDKADNLFYNARFPDGWSKQRTDHSMYTNIIDDKGRVRGSIGYKAAFYDRWASCSLNDRYYTDIKDYDEKPMSYVVKDRQGDGIVFTSSTKFNNMFDDDGEFARASCIGWLDKNYPDWRSPVAYWD